MDKEILSLVRNLEKIGNKNAAKDIFNIVSVANAIPAWESVIKEVDAPIPQQIFGVASGYIASGLKPLYTAAKTLAGYKYEELMFMVEIGKMIPGAIGEYGINLSALMKFSSEFNGMTKTAQASSVAGIIKTFGTQALKYIPAIGVLFSALMAIKNLVYGFREYKRLVNESSKIGLSWSETLFSENLEAKLEENSENPEKLMTLTRLCKHAKVFVSEVISFIANYIDFCKDLLFLLAEVLIATGALFFPPSLLVSLGIASVDIFISILIAIAEYSVEKVAMKKYGIILSRIRGVAQNNIMEINTEKLVERAKEITPDNKEQELDFDSWDYEQLYEFITGTSGKFA